MNIAISTFYLYIYPSFLPSLCFFPSLSTYICISTSLSHSQTKCGSEPNHSVFVYKNTHTILHNTCESSEWLSVFYCVLWTESEWVPVPPKEKKEKEKEQLEEEQEEDKVFQKPSGPVRTISL